MKSIGSHLLGLAFALTGTVAFAAEPMIVESAGTIHDIDYGRNEAIISGVRYRFALDARVEIGGSYGAVSMLTNGMNVKFVFKRFANGAREITSAQQVAYIDEY
ncbi:MAG: hypothetical protein O7H39_15370 [Gammaproteobacteria bacterium]|nr:hypothetical protein [Gammaproteobacteria bacterium]